MADAPPPGTSLDTVLYELLRGISMLASANASRPRPPLGCHESRERCSGRWRYRPSNLETIVLVDARSRARTTAEPANHFGKSLDDTVLAFVQFQQVLRGIVLGIDLRLGDHAAVTGKGIEPVAELALQRVVAGTVAVGILPEGVDAGSRVGVSIHVGGPWCERCRNARKPKSPGASVEDPGRLRWTRLRALQGAFPSGDVVWRPRA